MANCGVTDSMAKTIAQAISSNNNSSSSSNNNSNNRNLEELTLDSNLLSADAVLELVRAGRGLVALRVSNQVNIIVISSINYFTLNKCKQMHG